MLRIRAALMREHDMVLNKKLILSIMRELGIKGLPGPKRRKKNLVNQATEEDWSSATSRWTARLRRARSVFFGFSEEHNLTME
jgi:hypothetical protein